MNLPRLGVQRLLFLVFLGFLFVVSARPLVDTDLWWHLANGRYILAHGVPAQDAYSYTAVGHVWVVHEWLADVVFFVVHQASGMLGLILLSAVVITGWGWLVYGLLRRGGLGNNSAVVLAIVLALAGSPSWGARPQILNFLLTAMLCTLLLRYRERPGRWLYALVPFFVLWANLHSGYVVGIGLLVVYLVGEGIQALRPSAAVARANDAVILGRRELRRVAIVGAVGLLAGFATPGGYRTVVFALGTLSSSRIQSLILEWGSPNFHLTVDGMPNLAGAMLLLAIIVLVAGAVGALRTRRATDPTLVLWGLAGLVLALTSQRHVPIFAVAAAPLLGATASGLLAAVGLKPRAQPTPPPGIAAANLVIIAVLALAGAFYVGLQNSGTAIDRAVAAVEPVGATDYLLANHPPSRIFNYYGYGGWLVWKASPDYPVFIDGRTEVYGDQVFDEYIKVEFLNDRWQEPLDKYGVRTILIPVGDPLRLVLPGAGWKLAYQDSTARVYTR
jgi:hypothetical protein